MGLRSVGSETTKSVIENASEDKRKRVWASEGVTANRFRGYRHGERKHRYRACKNWRSKQLFSPSPLSHRLPSTIGFLRSTLFLLRPLMILLPFPETSDNPISLSYFSRFFNYYKRKQVMNWTTTVFKKEDLLVNVFKFLKTEIRVCLWKFNFGLYVSYMVKRFNVCFLRKYLKIKIKYLNIKMIRIVFKFKVKLFQISLIL